MKGWRQSRRVFSSPRGWVSRRTALPCAAGSAPPAPLCRHSGGLQPARGCSAQREPRRYKSILPDQPPLLHRRRCSNSRSSSGGVGVQGPSLQSALCPTPRATTPASATPCTASPCPALRGASQAASPEVTARIQSPNPIFYCCLLPLEPPGRVLVASSPGQPSPSSPGVAAAARGADVSWPSLAGVQAKPHTPHRISTLPRGDEIQPAN